MSDASKRLYTLWMRVTKAGMLAKVNSLFGDSTAEEKAKSEELIAKSQLLHHLFWYNIREEHGIRKGFKVVTFVSKEG